MIARLHYSKNGKIRFIGHRDVARVLERALRVGGIPVAYSQGFSPRPKLAFGLALAVSYRSDNEYLDVVLSESMPVEDILDQVSPALPDGIELISVGLVEPGSTSLMESVTSCEWGLTIDVAGEGSSIAAARASVDRVLAADNIDITRQRKGKSVTDDIRPDVLALEVSMNTNDASVNIRAELSTASRSLRPAEFISVLDPNLAVSSVRRKHQWISSAGTRNEPHQAVSASATRRELHVRRTSGAAAPGE